MPRQHVWTERAEDGVKREVRATWFGRRWRLQAKRADESGWTYYDWPLLTDLLALKELIARKYQRRRATSDELSAVEELLKQHNEQTR